MTKKKKAQQQAQEAQPPQPQPPQTGQQGQQGGREGQVGQEGPISDLDRSLNEIIQSNSARAAKRKRESEPSNASGSAAPAGPASSALIPFDSFAPRAFPSAFGQSDAGDMPVAKRPKLESVRIDSVKKVMSHGFARRLYVDDDTPNFEAFGGNTTLAEVNNIESFKQVIGNVLDRQFRANNNQFGAMSMAFLPHSTKKAKMIQGNRGLSNRSQSLLGDTSRVQELGSGSGFGSGSKDVRMEDVGSAAAVAAPPATATPPLAPPPAPFPATQGGKVATKGGNQQQQQEQQTAKARDESRRGHRGKSWKKQEKEQKILKELDQDMDKYFAAGPILREP
ncbi:hypothetical protein F4820DRAFT_441562 [Hypoxylon rubiginosum]|uniref:Uncharacterized protein n=1 Tax=Hypoxylon rubiginosum TaxID=110542 RepID=A0ACB9YIS1_9PEZI|nr:hypothetical protein F4820DRAFT_441562 [Hypoxylon rubiginosum]